MKVPMEWPYINDCSYFTILSYRVLLCVAYHVMLVGADVAANWEEKFSEKYQRKYWKNKVTGESVWKDPNKAAKASTY